MSKKSQRSRRKHKHQHHYARDNNTARQEHSIKTEDDLGRSMKPYRFWLCAGLLIVLLCAIMGRDINRPFYGLHSWADAHGPWLARVQVRHGLGYTKGLYTWAVGDPPTENPTRYLDHPQLPGLLNAAFMAVLGVNRWALRVENIIATVVTLLLFLKILRGLVDDKTALLSGLFFCLFPIIGYFGVNMWLYPLCFWAIWCYLVLIEELNDGPGPRGVHKFGLAAGLFLALQISWEGFFFALAIGVHYVFRCIRRKKMPGKILLAILIIAPLSSLLLDFMIMAAGYGWDFQKIVDLYNWRAGSGEMPQHDWGKWFGQFREHAVTNFTIPILIIAIVYLTFGQLLVFMKTKPSKKSKRRTRQFPLLLLFLMPAVFQLFLLKGALWRHQTWIRPFALFISIATACGIMLLGDLLRKIHKIISYAAMTALVAVSVIFCVNGVKHYYYMRWQAPEKMEMFEMLQKKIPPDKALLSYEDFIVNQHSSKGAFYRPEIAWHLDREIVRATSLQEVQKYARTGEYPCYLVPSEPRWSQRTIALFRQAQAANIGPTQRAQLEALAQEAYLNELKQWNLLIEPLKKLYQSQYIPAVQGESTKDGKFLKAGMTSYMIFDLNSKAG